MMRIGNNSNINFGNAIRVTTNGFENSFVNGYGMKSRRDSLSADITLSLNNQTPINYDKAISREICEFLKSNITDIGNQRVLGRAIEGEYYIFTGKEVQKAKKIIAEAKKEKQELDDKYEKGATEDMSAAKQMEVRSDSLHRIYRHNITLEQNKKLLELAKGGEDSDTINIIADGNKIEAIEYIPNKSASNDVQYAKSKKILSV